MKNPLRKLTAEVQSRNVLTAMRAAKSLGEMRTPDALPGICQALEKSSLIRYVIEGLTSDGLSKMDDSFVEAIVPALVRATLRHGDDAPAVTALKIDRGKAVPLLYPALKSRRIPFPMESLLKILHAGGLSISDGYLACLAAELWPHRENLRAVLALDAIVAKLAAGDGSPIDGELGRAVEEERARERTKEEKQQAPSRAFLRIAESGKDDIDKVCSLHQELDDRMGRMGVWVGFDDDREMELKYLSRPEWIIRALNYFFCCCESNGALHRNFELGSGLIEGMKEVGLEGCVRAMEAIAPLLDEQAALGEPDDEEAADECIRKEEDIDSRLKQAERLAEGWEDCSAAIWRFALRHQQEVLPVA
jgi:hypothetical protein